jgi:hypothetical protein
VRKSKTAAYDADFARGLSLTFAREHRLDDDGRKALVNVFTNIMQRARYLERTRIQYAARRAVRK